MRVCTALLFFLCVLISSHERHGGLASDKIPAQLFYDDFVSFHYTAWRQEPPTVMNGDQDPLIEPKFPWDEDVHAHGTVLFDVNDNLYKAWYVSTPATALTPGTSAETGRALTYAYSKDGIAWVRPMLDIVKYNRNQPTNILLKLPGGKFVQYASVFVDDRKRYPRPYEMFVLAEEAPEGFQNKTTSVCPSRCLYRYDSVDGIHWDPKEIVLGFPEGGTDGLYVYKNYSTPNPVPLYYAYIKVNLPAQPGQFVGYDIGAGKQRVIARTTSLDGSTWTGPTIVATPDWRDNLGDQLVELTTNPVRAEPRERAGGGATLIGAFTVIHTTSQTIDIQFGASRNGKAWWRPTRRPAIPLQPLGDYGGGITWPMRTLVLDRELNDGTCHLYYSGTEGLHSDIYSTMPQESFDELGIGKGKGCWDFRDLRLGGGTIPRGNEQLFASISNNIWFRGAILRATFKKGRLWGLVPSVGGEMPGVVVTRNFSLGYAAVLVINAATVRGGNITAEVLVNKTVLSGYSFDDCVPFQGDETSSLVEWKAPSHDPMAVATNRQIPKFPFPIQVRFRLLRSRLYYFHFEDAESG
jgi:hypothetical protein